MVQIAGKYQLVKNENFVKHLIAYGTSEEDAKKVDALRPILEVVLDGKKISLNSDSGVDNASSTFTLDQEVDEVMPMNTTVKSTATIDGDTLLITSKTPAGRISVRKYKFSDSDLVLTMTSSDGKIPEGKRTYKRI